MLLTIPQLLNAEQLSAVRAIVGRGSFADGRMTAGANLHDLKNNLQLETGPEDTRALDGIVLVSLWNHPTFKIFARPRRMMNARISRYDEGMGYGSHIDSPYMGRGEAIRGDLSVTVFLNDPSEYDGGLLVLETPYGPQEVKLFAGDAVAYATLLHHEVTKVTRGSRLVAITWVQSYIADPLKRQILFELQQAKLLIAENGTQSEANRLLTRAHANLCRLWSDG